MNLPTTLEIPVKGMDCAECAMHVEHALAALPGVAGVDVFLTSEKAILHLEQTAQLEISEIRQAVEKAGYTVPAMANESAPAAPGQFESFTRTAANLFGVVFGAVLFIVVIGEWLGLFEKLTTLIPWYLGLTIVILGGLPIYQNVIRAALQRKVLAHTLMTFGVIAALLVGEWITAAVVVFLMRVGNYVEGFTTERSRRAVKDLAAMAPKTARVVRAGEEQIVPVESVQPGEHIVVRPGEKIPVDGLVLTGHAVINQAAITGEAMPVEAGPGAKVYAATLAQLGSLEVQATHAAADSTFGRVIKLVEEAEAHRADVQTIADRFSAWYLPVVASLAALTLLLRQDPLAAAAVLVVACSCAFALATPIAMLASIGAGAKKGLLVKGGKYLELLSRADVLLLDKTGTLTLGRPHIEAIFPLNGQPPEHILALAASAERYSEHPLAEAVRSAARQRGLQPGAPQDFSAEPGKGVRARVNGSWVEVGSHRILPAGQLIPAEIQEKTEGKSVLYVVENGHLLGLLTAADTLRPEVPAALARVKNLGIQTIELLTGDSPQTAAELASQLGVAYQANLLPEDKIAIVRAYQSAGRTVVMVGDGVNDAPALAQADVGIAMGAAGTDIAFEAAHVALMREDWNLVPMLFQLARRTMRVVRLNIGFTAVYNLVGLSLAALGFLPPVLAAAAQSLPDIGILANSSRLLRQKL